MQRDCVGWQHVPTTVSSPNIEQADIMPTLTPTDRIPEHTDEAIGQAVMSATPIAATATIE